MATPTSKPKLKVKITAKSAPATKPNAAKDPEAYKKWAAQQRAKANALRPQAQRDAVKRKKDYEKQLKWSGPLK